MIETLSVAVVGVEEAVSAFEDEREGEIGPFDTTLLGISTVLLLRLPATELAWLPPGLTGVPMAPL